MPRLRNRTADFGVCIHEGRFTWKNEGLGLVEDLGTRWEVETNSPLPLGGIVARRSLDRKILQKIQAVIHDSLQLALTEPSIAIPTMRRYSQEFDDEVLMKHVELYVNDWTVDLGEGRVVACRPVRPHGAWRWHREGEREGWYDNRRRAWHYDKW